MNRYRLSNSEIDESASYTPDGHGVAAARRKDGKMKEETRHFPTTIQDFVSGFYLLRRLPVDSESCTLIYGNQRAYTVWLKPSGRDEIKTPVGLRLAQRYEVRYGSDKSPKLINGSVWLGVDAEHVPYKAELDGPHRVEVSIHLYQPGSAAPITAK